MGLLQQRYPEGAQDELLFFTDPRKTVRNFLDINPARKDKSEIDHFAVVSALSVKDSWTIYLHSPLFWLKYVIFCVDQGSHVGVECLGLMDGGEGNQVKETRGNRKASTGSRVNVESSIHMKT